jgi:MFS family permease
MVVLFQFAITRRIEGLPPFAVLAAGTALYVIGFGMYGFVSSYWLFMLAMAIITVGEMLTAPVGQAVAAGMAPGDMRGRYMAAYSFSWMLPSAAGIYLAGLIMDNADPNWVWYAAGLVALIPTAAYWWMHRHKALAQRDGELKPAAAETWG